MSIKEKIMRFVKAQGNQVGSGAELGEILDEMVDSMPGPPGPQGPQGPQGNTGSSVDYPYELVNNLTTDDPEKGLSAAQGVVLKGEISQLGQEVADIFPEVISEEYVDAVVDKDYRIIEATKQDGTKVISKLETPGLEKYISAEVDGFIDAVVDSNKRLIYGIRKDGSLYIQKLNSPTLEGYVPMAQLEMLSSRLYGKKWIVIGDSFTRGGVENGTIQDGIYAGQYKVYPYLIGNRTGLNVVRFFEGGRTLAFPAIPGAFVNSITNPNADFYYQNIPSDADYITIYLGTNDYSHSIGTSPDQEPTEGQIPLGTQTDNNASTYFGAWNVVLSWLRENRPFAHIGIIISNGFTGIEDTEPVQHCLSWVNAQIEMAKKYGYPYLNLNGDDRTPAMIRCINSNIPVSVRNQIIEQQAVDLTSNPKNQHPNAAAHLFESYFIENFLLTI